MSNAATDRNIDTRPRVSYRLPDGSVGPIIFDHGEVVPPAVTFTAGGRVRMAYIVDASLVGSVLP